MKQVSRYRRWKRVLIVLSVLILTFMAYVAYVNRSTPYMTGKQKIMKAVYPLLMGITRLLGKNNKVMSNESLVTAPQSLYDLSVTLNNNSELTFASLRGKKILIVNTASECGYTNQYTDLQKLYEQYQEKLVIIGFPANDFQEQEKGSDEEIGQFCKINFGVSFPLAKKSVVVKSPEQNPVFAWLTSKARNGWNEQQPSWNFSKYLINERGVLTHYFDPSVSPTSTVVIAAVEK